MIEKQKTLQDVHEMIRRVAGHRGWMVNADADFTNDLAQGLLTNFNRYGYYLCPCRDTNGSRETDRDVLCPCDYAPADIKEYGQCYCALYLDPAFAASGSQPRPIPERRPD